MAFCPTNLLDWTDVVTKVLGMLFGAVGGGWGLYQYFRATKIRAAETLLRLTAWIRDHAEDLCAARRPAGARA